MEKLGSVQDGVPSALDREDTYPQTALTRALIAALAVLSVGCPTVPDEEEDEACSADTHATTIMNRDWLEAEMFRRDCYTESESEFQDCLDDEEIPGSECSDNHDSQELFCDDVYRRWSNQLPLRECGVPIFIEVDDPEEGQNPWTVNLNDEDGDGINTWMEYWMGYNPCSAHSFYTPECKADGEFDYDADGIPDGQDPYPLCYDWDAIGTDPGAWGSDCV